MPKSVETSRIAFCLCPNCFRAVPEAAGEHYCTNCGTPMRSACQVCNSPITSPEARFCGKCGSSLTQDKNH